MVVWGTDTTVTKQKTGEKMVSFNHNTVFPLIFVKQHTVLFLSHDNIMVALQLGYLIVKVRYYSKMDPPLQNIVLVSEL